MQKWSYWKIKKKYKNINTNLIMEIKFKQGDSVTIPEGCKAVVSDGTVVFEKAKTNFKAGEVITGNTGEILLVRECSG